MEKTVRWGRKMIPGKKTICDVPQELKGEDFTHHRNHTTMGSAKDHNAQGSRWFAAFQSFELWNRHPLMRNYSTEGVLMTQLCNHSAGLCPPGSTARVMWCAITDKHMWKTPGSKTKGIPWAMFFDELITIDGVTDWASAFHYWLNILADVDPSEEGLHNNELRMACKMDALSEDKDKAVPFTTAACGKWKAAVQSNTKRAKSMEKHNIEANRRGLFGDQRVKVASKKRTRDEAAAPSSPVLVRSFRSCGECQLSTLEQSLYEGFCKDCWEEWNGTSGDDSATQEREAQAQALADELLKEKVKAGEARLNKEKVDKEEADNEEADKEKTAKRAVKEVATEKAAKKQADKAETNEAKAARNAARKAARKAAKEKAPNEQAANAQAANEEPSAPPAAIRLNPRPARRACGSLDSDTNAAMFTLGAECTCVPSPTFDAMCGCAGAEVEGNWGKSHNFWDNKGTISAATYDAPSKCWAYSIKWLDSTEEDSNQRWYFGDKVKCIRARGI